FILPYPQTVGYRRTDISTEMHNFGIRDLQSVRGGWGWRSGPVGREYPIIGPSIVAGNSAVIYITDYTIAQRGWTPIEAGVFTVYARTMVGQITPEDPSDDDMNLSNDSTSYAGVNVLPATMYELGHDFRRAVNGFNFTQGEGPAVRFSPRDIGLNNYTIGAVSFRFLGGQVGAAAAQLHIRSANQENLPGQDRLALDIIVPANRTNPNNFTVPLYSHEELRNISGDFWVWLELTREDGRPAIMGNQHEENIDRFYRFNGDTTQPINVDLLIHPLITSRRDTSADLAASAASIDFGEVIRGRQRTRSVTLFSSGLQPVVIRNVTCDNARFTFNWERERELSFGQSVSFNVVFRPEDETDQEGHLAIESTDQEPPVVTFYGYGTLAAPQPETAPGQFGLEPLYPNPFNQQARVAFNLDRPDNVKILLFDISGRELKALTEGSYPAGRHALTFNAEGLPVGLYLIKLETSTRTEIRKALLVK
ncbi:MAG: T9SS type A sorting domain-containing protein, partial [Calditrichota bacterium]